MTFHIGGLKLHAPRLHSRSPSPAAAPAPPPAPSYAAAHKFLFTPKLFAHLLLHVWDDGAPGARATLLALALTARDLSEPALHRLWEQLDGIGPLLHNAFVNEDADTTVYPGHPPYTILKVRTQGIRCV